MKRMSKDGNLPQSSISRINIVKIAIHTYKAIPITIPTQFFTETGLGVS